MLSSRLRTFQYAISDIFHLANSLGRFASKIALVAAQMRVNHPSKYRSRLPFVMGESLCVGSAKTEMRCQEFSLQARGTASPVQ